ILQTRTTHTSITQCITQHRSTHLAIEPLHSCLAACQKVENSQASTISSFPSLHTLHNILRPQPCNNPALLVLPPIGPVSWREISHTDRYRAASDLLWLATWQWLPIGRPIAKISQTNPNVLGAQIQNTILSTSSTNVILQAQYGTPPNSYTLPALTPYLPPTPLTPPLPLNNSIFSALSNLQPCSQYGMPSHLEPLGTIPHYPSHTYLINS